MIGVGKCEAIGKVLHAYLRGPCHLLRILRIYKGNPALRTPKGKAKPVNPTAFQNRAASRDTTGSRRHFLLVNDAHARAKLGKIAS